MKSIYIIAFLLLAEAQLFVPAKMIWDKEHVLAEGEEFLFKTAPIDPYDPFRGKYITLSYEADEFLIEDSETEDWYDGQEVYVLLVKDEDGFAKIWDVKSTEEVPEGDNPYVTASIRYVQGKKVYDQSNVFRPSKLVIDYPFTRFYMDEDKAYDAEVLARVSRRDSLKNVYAVVAVKEGDAVINDVMVDGVPIKELVEQQQSQ